MTTVLPLDTVTRSACGYVFLTSWMFFHEFSFVCVIQLNREFFAFGCFWAYSRIFVFVIIRMFCLLSIWQHSCLFKYIVYCYDVFLLGGGDINDLWDTSTYLLALVFF